MTNQEWHERYVARLVYKGMTYREAQDIVSRGKHDHGGNPESAAEEELSYWREESSQ